MHLSDVVLRTLADGERSILASDGRSSDVAAYHLAECVTCTSRMARLQDDDREMARALAALDHALPPVSIARLRARAARPPIRHTPAIAAGLLLSLVVGAAAMAAPGSRVLGWLTLSRAERSDSGEMVPAPPRPLATQGTSAGFAIVPTDSVDIVFLNAQRSGVVRVRLVADRSLRITHEGGSAAYALTRAGVAVENAESAADYELSLPRAVRVARIRIGSRVVLTKRNAAVSSGARQDSTGVYVVPLALFPWR